MVGAGLNLFLGTGQLLLFTFGVFVKPIVADTGWARAVVGSAPLCGQLLLALCAPFVGVAVDRFGPRAIARVAGPMLAIGMCLIGLLARSPGTFVLAFGLSFLFGAGQVPVPYVKAVAGWYERKLDLALGSAMVFSGIGVAVLPPASAWLIAEVGWRAAYCCLATLVAGTNLLSVALLIREPNRGAEIQRKISRPVNSRMAPVLIRLKTRAFFVMAASFFLIAVAVGAGAWALPVVLNDIGVPSQRSAFVMTVVGFSMTVARFGFGALLDRVEPRRLTALAFSSAGVGMTLLAIGPSSSLTVLLAAVLIGLALGSEVDAMAFLSARAFGIVDLGVVYGALSFFFSLGLGCGPALLSQTMRLTGNFTAGFWISAWAAALAALAILALDAGEDR